MGNGSAIDENGNTSLRAALEEGKWLVGPHTINFSATVFASGTHAIYIFNQELDLDEDFTINGPTAADVILYRPYLEPGAYRILKVNQNRTATISNLDFDGGYVPGDSGGAILNEGTLTLNSCNVTNGRAAAGGGIANQKELWLFECNVSDNYASDGGGGISTAANPNCATHLEGTVVTNNTAGTSIVGGKGGGISLLANALLTVFGGGVTGNSVGENGIGGGIYNSGGLVNLDGCSISSNSADNGGGVYCAGGTTNLDGVTVAANWAESWGGGLFLEPGSTVNLHDSTFTNTNDAGGDGPLAAFSGVFQVTVFVTITGTCVGITLNDFIDLD